MYHLNRMYTLRIKSDSLLTLLSWLFYDFLAHFWHIHMAFAGAEAYHQALTPDCAFHACFYNLDCHAKLSSLDLVCLYSAEPLFFVAIVLAVLFSSLDRQQGDYTPCDYNHGELVDPVDQMPFRIPSGPSYPPDSLLLRHLRIR